MAIFSCRPSPTLLLLALSKRINLLTKSSFPTPPFGSAAGFQLDLCTQCLFSLLKPTNTKGGQLTVGAINHSPDLVHCRVLHDAIRASNGHIFSTAMLPGAMPPKLPLRFALNRSQMISFRKREFCDRLSHIAFIVQRSNLILLESMLISISFANVFARNESSSVSLWLVSSLRFFMHLDPHSTISFLIAAFVLCYLN